MTTPISDDELAEIERDILAQAQIMSGQCEGGVWLRGGDCPKCQATRHDRCQFPLPQSYAIPSNVEALIARLRAAEADAKRYRWLCASAWYVGPEPCGDTEAVSWHDHNETTDGVTEAIDKAIAMERTP